WPAWPRCGSRPNMPARPAWRPSTWCPATRATPRCRSCSRPEGESAMPEYLAPGVYVEETDTGSKPIDAGSTSTAGMIGGTERGPVNGPILITRYGEFRRWFGETLTADVYGPHRFLPHAVEGFFVNGGKRVYVTRVLNLGAAALAHTRLFLHQEGIASGTLMTRAAATAGRLPLGWPGAPGAVLANHLPRLGRASGTPTT